MPDKSFLVLCLESHWTGEQSTPSKPGFSLVVSFGVFFPSCYHDLRSGSYCTIVTSDVKESRVPLANLTIQPYGAIISLFITSWTAWEGRDVCACTHTHVRTPTHTDSWKTGDKIKLKSTTLKDLELLIFIADTDTNILWGLELSVLKKKVISSLTLFVFIRR